jgi:hypothetical protein
MMIALSFGLGFEQAGLVPDLLPAFNPQGTLNVSYTVISTNCRSLLLKLTSSLSFLDTLIRWQSSPSSRTEHIDSRYSSLPRISALPRANRTTKSGRHLDAHDVRPRFADAFQPFRVSQPFTLCHTNVILLLRVLRAKLHLLATAIALDRYPDPVENYKLVNRTRFVVDWLPPAPGPQTGIHRYAFLLYKGVPSQESVQPFQDAAFNRSGFNLTQFTRTAGIQDPYAGTFLTIDSALPENVIKQSEFRFK